jgi:hypothetical protein
MNVSISDKDYREKTIKYCVEDLGEITLKFDCATDGELDSFTLNGADYYLDCKDDIMIAFNGAFQTIQEIFDKTVNEAIELHASIGRSNGAEVNAWQRHCASFGGGKL